MDNDIHDRMNAAAKRAEKAGLSKQRQREAAAAAENRREAMIAKEATDPKLPEPSPYDVDLDDRTHAELAIAAKERGIDGVETMSRTQLIHAMREHFQPHDQG